MKGGAYGRGRRAANMAVAASAALHAVLLVLLIRHLAQGPRATETPVLQISLVPPPVESTPAQAPPPRPAPGARHRGAPAAPPSAMEYSGSPDAGPATAPLGEDGMAAAAPQALRGFGGCDRGRLTAEERERCEARRWAGAGPPGRRVDLDPRGRYAESPEPFLARRPKDGCRLRATGDVDPMGDSGNVRAGTTCVVPF